MSKELDFYKWYPIEEYFDNIEQMDWALVQFREKDSGFIGLPHIAEFRRGKWYLQDDEKDLYTHYINETCEPIAFMLWKPISLTDKGELEQIRNVKSSEALECLESIRERFSDDSKGNNSWGFNISKELNTIKQALMQRETNSMYVEKLANKEIEHIHTINELKQALTTKSKKELAFEIIKEKDVDIHLLKACITCYKDSLNAYNSEIKKLYSNHKDYQNKPLSFYLLTEEEFELLKECFE